MVDIHTHIIPNVDDGSKSIEDTFALFREAAEEGFSDIILTPHYIEGTEYSAENKEKLERYELLKKEIDKKYNDIVSFSELEEFIDNPVRT